MLVKSHQEINIKNEECPQEDPKDNQYSIHPVRIKIAIFYRLLHRSERFLPLDLPTSILLLS